MEKKRRLIVFCPTIIVIVLSTILCGCVGQTFPSYTQPERGKIYFVGVGPMGPDLCTLQAIKVIQEADVIYVNERRKLWFREYLKNKDVRSDRLKAVYHPSGKSYTSFDKASEWKEFRKRLRRWIREMAKELDSEAKKGKSVAFLEGGDPCIYGAFYPLTRFLNEDDYIVIPGVSAFNAGNALLKKEISKVDRRAYGSTIIIHSPINENRFKGPTTRDLAKHQVTMVFFMAGGMMKSLVDDLSESYNEDTPIAVCYFIGDPKKEKVIIGKLKDIISKTSQEEETNLVLIYVGDFLKQ